MWAKRHLELVSSDADLGVQTRCHDGDRGLTVSGQALLRGGALCAKVDDRGMHGRVMTVELLHRAPECFHDMVEHHLIKIGATETFEILWRADNLGSVGRHGDDRGVERGAEVVYRHRVAHRNQTRVGAVAYSGGRLADQFDVGEADLCCHVGEQLELVLAPICRMGECQGSRRGIDAGSVDNGSQ